MDATLLERLLYEEEGETLDFKEMQYPFSGASKEQKSELLKDILGFANAWRRAEAYIIIGVKEVRGGRSTVVGTTNHLDDRASSPRSPKIRFKGKKKRQKRLSGHLWGESRGPRHTQFHVFLSTRWRADGQLLEFEKSDPTLAILGHPFTFNATDLADRRDSTNVH